MVTLEYSAVLTQPESYSIGNQGLTVWAPVYKPTGNAGNEYNFVPWLQSYDLMLPYLMLMGTYNSTIVMLDVAYCFIPALNSSYGTRPEMYRTERLLVCAFASIVFGNQKQINISMAFISSHATTNMFSV